MRKRSCRFVARGRPSMKSRRQSSPGKSIPSYRFATMATACSVYVNGVFVASMSLAEKVLNFSSVSTSFFTALPRQLV
jgi:hypothetical protein